MVLLGGRTGAEVDGHDWEYILTQLGMLHFDGRLGMSAYALGMIVMVASLAVAVRTVLRNSE
jgi:hypothetical protein